MSAEPMPTVIVLDDIDISEIAPGVIGARYGELYFEGKTSGVTRDQPEQWSRMMTSIAEELVLQAELNNVDQQARMQRMKSGLIDDLTIAFSVPLGFLAVGAALLWAFRGFRKAS
jgi:hypothetical protein